MPAPRKLEAQFNRAHMSYKDFGEAEEYLHAYRDELSDTCKRVLLVAAIMAYARPFTSNDGGAEGLSTGTLMGNPRRILKKKEFVLHEKVLRLRHEALAHSDYGRRPTRLIETGETSFLAKSKPFDVLSETIAVTALPIHMHQNEKSLH